MTREEAIALFEKQLTAAQVVLDSGFGSNPGENNFLYRRRKEMAEIALTALRPISREQVEKVFPGCDYCKYIWMERLDLKPCASGNIGVKLKIGRVSEDDAFGILAYYRNTAAGYIDFPFCPFCGRPMTDEAVEMVMERLNKQEETKK